MSEQFLRQEMLLGTDAMSRLHRSHVAVFGLGGVGSWCAEALARAGIGRLTLIDRDTVSESNINRQLEATALTLGMSKAEAMAKRLREIVPEIEAIPLTAHYDAEHRTRFFDPYDPYDFIVDAIDLVSCKLDLILTARERGIPMISALGTGNKLDAARLCISDISKTQGCPLARVMRKELRARGIAHHPVVYSPELALTPETDEAPPPGRRSIPGSVVWVPATAGLLLAQHVVTELSKTTE